MESVRYEFVKKLIRKKWITRISLLPCTRIHPQPLEIVTFVDIPHVCIIWLAL
jgi:hypothetical protein